GLLRDLRDRRRTAAASLVRPDPDRPRRPSAAHGFAAGPRRGTMMRARSGQVDRSGSMLHDIGSHPREEGMAEGTPGFEDDIKPLFRESDRKRMEFAFDLWSHEDVKQNAE